MPFRDILGHRRILELISHALEHDRLAPSLVLAGPAGVGKRLTATAIAQAFNCLSPVRPAGGSTASPEAAAASNLPLDACGQCSPCRRIARGSFPDVVALERPPDRAGISVEQVRTATAEIAFRPFEGRRRVIIIDDAAELNTDAQDALLKSLEEPPPTAAFLLVTASPDALRPTIRSRCARLRFGPLPAPDVARWLEAHQQLDAHRARTVSLVAGGSLGAAVQMADGTFGDEQAMALEVLRRAAAGSSVDSRLDCAQPLQPQDKGPSGRQRDRLAVHLRVLASLIRDTAALASGAPADALVNVDLAEDLRALAPTFGGERAVRAFQAVQRALAALEANANPKIVPDWLAFQL